jgi:hypothetical protein
MGSVSGSIHAILPALTQRVSIDNIINGNVSTDIKEQFRRVTLRNNLSMEAVAYTMDVHRTNLPTTGAANVTLTVPVSWVDQNGGQDAVRIGRISDETGMTELLETIYTGRDPKGNMVFRGDSPNGSSVFGMLTAKATVEKQQEQPNVTLQPMQKPAIITDIGMFAWMLGILKENPIIIGIVLAVMAVVAYFGWYKRRIYL